MKGNTKRTFSRWLLRSSLLASIIFLFGCGINLGGSKETFSYPPLAVNGQYPTATSNLYFAKAFDGYGDYVGLAGFPIDRPDAGWLGNSPGFEFYQGHQGGYGDTLEVVSYSNGIYLHWAYNKLWGIGLFEGWQGQIIIEKNQLTGIHLGSNASDFVKRFPNATEGTMSRLGFGGRSYRVSMEINTTPGWINVKNLTADCDADGIIRRLRIDPYYPPDFDDYWGPK